ncbi:prolipoprotein diacylglyceryl transferase [Veronia pacifica]|uniref:Phosphatidylglycerol--prolipoprotein diacylglyceryl transferase n=1 Tax=Veronia pacifica TaxID=1080227 RepID=A0A1C3EDX6_9GAMM|nr:prolipoprotein diacylglyceryl transferase [Veronia pacifica]ODA31457.1 prolipoprotein diacylglyceryl transferase [Veronia pacifica]
MIWNVDPILLSLGPLQIHWYGVLFATAILSGFQVMKWIYKQENRDVESLDSLLIYAVVGIIVGARLGHCFFYDPAYYLANPMKIIAVWEGGLASHGGGLGAILAVFFYCKKDDVNFIWLLDRLAIATSIFGFFVRMANFINSEIIGKPTGVPWAIVFEKYDFLPRHPVQVYEAIAYLSIFVFLLVMYRTTKIKEMAGALFGAFLCLVFTARFSLEFVKIKQAAYSSDLALNTGQLLSIPFFIAGVVLLVSAVVRYKRTQTV